ncbi:TonB-dependent receptor [Sphingobacterium sp. Mn56C]|uniref:TonB-dependent receptor n=1 Tax=Sphingobacterium sp. Mn56C TaxID=3395261 RepID=UPI003BCA2A56
MIRSTLFFALALTSFSALSQSTLQDSTHIDLQPVSVKVYFAPQSLMSITSSTQVVGPKTLTAQGSQTLVSALNTVPGIRMEERSPGSYRLAMRGSLIRSPFGIRNTKIYVDDFALTDAGGNTYLNLLDPLGIQSIHVLKGPDGSLFGANSGGVIRIQPKGFDALENQVQLQVTGGSYGLFQEQLSVQRKVSDRYQFSFDHSFLRSDGYRENTALNKKTLQTSHQWQVSKIQQLRLFALYTDLKYNTPGGLTLSQYEANPRAARPAAGKIPGAAEQQAGIYNKTLFGGLSNALQLTESLSHHIALYGSYTDFKNPFITNFEKRIERNLGVRTYFSYAKPEAAMPWQMQLGYEGALGWNKIDNYDNLAGVAGKQQAMDNLDNRQWNLFYRAQVELLKNWNLEGSLGLNKNSIHYKQRFPEVNNPTGDIKFDAVWMPRMATSYQLNRLMALRASIAKGYSAPTLAEVRSSNRSINTDLAAERGTNYEIGYKFKTANNRFIADLAAYTYTMKDGIVRALDENGAEFFSNAGEMKQRGLELGTWLTLLEPRNFGFVRELTVQAALAYNHYRFGDYRVANKDYSKNKITAVPDWVNTNVVHLEFPQKLTLHLFHNYTSSLPLDDGNTVFAKKYNVLQAKLNWNTTLTKNTAINLFFGADNIFNEKYSLGNDINAFGGRYFNAAPMRNYYAGVRFDLK